MTFYRNDLDITLEDLNDHVNAESGEVSDVASQEIAFHLTDDEPTIVIGGRELPATERGRDAFASWLGVPGPFTKRLREAGPDLEQTVLTGLLQRSSGSAAAVQWTDVGVLDVRDPGSKPIPLARIVNVASRVLGNEKAPVQRLIDTPSEFSFDVHVPFDNRAGSVGGDLDSQVELPEALHDRSYLPANTRQVGDVTAGGLRIGYDRKHNLAPFVQPWMFRLICTNGMETTDNGLRVEARGASVDDVLAELQAAGERAFSRVDAQIRHFYDLRNTPVANPEREITRLARERGIPARSTAALMNLVPTEALPDNPTMFDVTNLVTNLANSGAMIRDGGRLLLERAGGSVIADHEARCAHCRSALA